MKVQENNDFQKFTDQQTEDKIKFIEPDDLLIRRVDDRFQDILNITLITERKKSTFNRGMLEPSTIAEKYLDGIEMMPVIFTNNNRNRFVERSIDFGDDGVFDFDDDDGVFVRYNVYPRKEQAGQRGK